MSISDQYTDFLFNYLTVNGKCAHHIDRPKSISINQNIFLKITNVYFSDQIEFKEHTFSIDQLPSFKCYRIKVLLLGSSQTYVPRFKNLRVIALA